MLIGDEITARGRLSDAYKKKDSSGEMLFIVFETEYANQRGELVARGDSSICDIRSQAAKPEDDVSSSIMAGSRKVF